MGYRVKLSQKEVWDKLISKSINDTWTFIVENANAKNKIVVLINTVKSGIERTLADLYIPPNYLYIIKRNLLTGMCG